MSETPCTHCGGTGHEPPPARLIVEVVMPIKTISEANRSPGGRRGKISRKKAQRHSAGHYLLETGVPRPTAAKLKRGVTVQMTRIAPALLDGHDNLPSALKHVADGIADWIGCDDRSEAITWLPPQQEQSKRGVYGVRVVIRERRGA